jgi:hypothetical protein
LFAHANLKEIMVGGLKKVGLALMNAIGANITFAKTAQAMN